MTDKIDEIISSCHKLLFPEFDSETQDTETRLNLSVEGLTWFATLQICLPIVTGLVSSFLYEKFKSTKNASQADSALNEIREIIGKFETNSRVDNETIKNAVIALLKANGFSEDESPELASKLIGEVQRHL